MEFDSFIGVVTNVGGWIAGSIAVGLIAYRQFRLGFGDTQNELIGLLSKTVETLKGEVKDLQEKHDQNEKDILRLSSVNETLTKVLQGRDEAYIKFQQEGFASFKRTKELHEDIKRLYELMERHLTDQEK